MTDSSVLVPNYWALVIGINYYRTDKCLKGSVRDANTVQQFLPSEDNTARVFKLTATAPSDESRQPLEDPKYWPTRANVASGLKDILLGSKTGDFVYVHYSGHGVKTPNMSQSTYNSTGELALVLFEDDEVGSSYLRGSHLAGALRKMVNKGLFVTLVLDCCFSGSSVRNEPWRSFDVRSARYDAAVDASSEKKHGTREFGIFDRSRNSRLKEDWLINPTGFTILAGCGPNEKAWELEENGERRGALTCFMLKALETLKKQRADVTYELLHEYIRANFHVSWPRQNPMRYGKAETSFFGGSWRIRGRDATGIQGYIPIYKRDDGGLGLGAGEVHGVYKGDQYDILPFGAYEVSPGRIRGSLQKMEVSAVRAFESDLIHIGNSPELNVETGWIAIPRSSVLEQKTRVGTSSNIAAKIMSQGASSLTQHLELVDEGIDQKPCHYSLVIEDDGYAVLNSLYKEIPGIPKLPVNDPATILGMMAILNHLATFKFFEGIENRLPDPDFESSYSLIPKSTSQPSGQFDVKHGDSWSLKISNVSTRALYVGIFNFTPSWEVVNIVAQSGEGDYLVISPKAGEETGEMNLSLDMEVPDAVQCRAETECEDIIKVFITNKPVSFPAMILPKIFGTRSGESMRGRNSTAKFLDELNTRFRETGGPKCLESWASRSFFIRTFMP